MLIAQAARAPLCWAVATVIPLANHGKEMSARVAYARVRIFEDALTNLWFGVCLVSIPIAHEGELAGLDGIKRIRSIANVHAGIGLSL